MTTLAFENNATCNIFQLNNAHSNVDSLKYTPWKQGKNKCRITQVNMKLPMNDIKAGFCE